MTNLELAVHKYASDQMNPELNYSLGVEYFQVKQLAAAFTFFLRAAELAKDKKLSYEALLDASVCIQKQGRRDSTEETILLTAISEVPQAPHAYYLLSLLYERRRDYHKMYLYAVLGIRKTYCFKPINAEIINYLGQWMLRYQLAVAAWKIGRYEQSRQEFIDLLEEGVVGKSHQEALNANITSIGLPKEFTKYWDYKNKIMRYPFRDSENIQWNYSQSYQDLFVLSVLGGRRQGIYLEIGSGHPFENSNTALLENQFDWTGISIDINKSQVLKFQQERQNTCICADALKLNYKDFLNEHYQSKEVDYLQIDCDPAQNSFTVLQLIMEQDFVFKVITFEHDAYKDTDFVERSRELLKSKGYKLAVAGLEWYPGRPYEDWWIHESVEFKPTVVSGYCEVVMFKQPGE